MGCATQQLNNEPMSVEFQGQDKQFIELIKSLEDRAIFQKTVTQLVQLCDNKLVLQNPAQVLDKLLNSLVYGEQSQYLAQLLSISQKILHQVYFRFKSDYKVSIQTKEQWLSLLQNLIPRSDIYCNEIEFHIDCLRAGINALNIGKLDISNQVLEFGQKALEFVRSDDKISSFSALKSSFKNILTQNCTWIEKVFSVNCQKDLFDVQMLKITGEWHVTYAVLNMLQQFISNNPDSIGNEIFEQLKEMALPQQTLQDAWRIREKIAWVLISVFPLQNETLSQQAAQILILMQLNERDKRVQRILQNKELILQRKQQMKKYIHENEETVKKTIEAKNNEVNSTTKFNHQEKDEWIQQISEFQSSLEIQLNLQLCESNIQQTVEMQNKMNSLEKAANGKNIQEIIQTIRSFNIQMLEELEQKDKYVPLNIVHCISDQNNEQQHIDVNSELQNFVIDEKQKVLLIQGDAGAGKSTLCRQIIRKYNNTHLIIFAVLSKIQNYNTELIHEILSEMRLNQKDILTIQTTNTPIILIVEGYDEVRCYKNLYNTNKLHDWNCKVIFTCRKQHLAQYQLYYKLFAPPNSNIQEVFEEYFIVPFNKDQINQYVQNFIQKTQIEKFTIKQWNSAISDIKGLDQLITNPFILSIVLQIIPSLNSSARKDINLLQIYEMFIKQWFDTHEQNETLNVQSESINNLSSEYQKFASQLSAKMTSMNKSAVEYKSTHRNQWSEFFDPNNKKQSIIRMGIPLNSNGTYNSFIHKTIQEYFTTLNGKTEIMKLVAQDINCIFAKYLIHDDGVLNFYKQMLLTDNNLQDLLFKVIYMSKNNKQYGIAAANAITILNYADVQMINKDFKGIQIQGANLSSAMLNNCDFSSADLTDVNFTQSWLYQCNFSNSIMENISFGKSSCIKSPRNISCIALDNTQQVLACIEYEQMGNNKQFSYLSLYCPKTKKLLQNTSKQVASLKLQNICFSQDNNFIYCTESEKVLAFNAQTLKFAFKLTEHQNKITSMQIYQNILVTGSKDNVIIVWNLENRTITHKFEESCNIQSIAISQDYISAAMSNNSIKIWSLKSFELINNIQAHKNKISCLQFNKNVLVSASFDQSLIFWDIQTGTNLKTINCGENIQIIKFSNDGILMVTGSNENAIKLYNVKNYQVISTLDGHTDNIGNVIFNNDDSIISSSRDNTIQFWDCQQQQSTILKQKPSHTERIRSVVISQNQLFVASASNDTTVMLWDAQSGRFLHKFVIAGNKPVLCACFSPDSATLACGAASQQIRVFELSSFKQQKFIKTASAVLYMCYSPAGDLFAYSCEDKSLVILEIPSYTVKYSIKCKSFTKRIQFGSNTSIECFNEENKQISINLENGEEIESRFQLKNQSEVNQSKVMASHSTSLYLEENEAVKWVSGQFALNLGKCVFDGAKGLTEDQMQLIEQNK
ncbi:WD40_repeat protein [Hexamita inflata]|uniref:WD40 repeat protein n=1 Tax=Hexamita inflata TaxID=28002 RepID=A0AA86PTS2_9EUKA|nr:WD40 repeat protein [Hexamita inflata]